MRSKITLVSSASGSWILLVVGRRKVLVLLEGGFLGYGGRPRPATMAASTAAGKQRIPKVAKVGSSEEPVEDGRGRGACPSLLVPGAGAGAVPGAGPLRAGPTGQRRGRLVTPERGSRSRGLWSWEVFAGSGKGSLSKDDLSPAVL